MTKEIKERLEYLREEIQAERNSYSGLIELESLAEYIEPGDIELLEWAGVPEFKQDNCVSCEKQESHEHND